MDWSDGKYELTADRLAPVSTRVLGNMGLTKGATVLDVGCGTGNAALEAARLGATTSGMDPAARLVEIARKRALAENLAIHFESGDASLLPFGDALFDFTVSIFAVIFAPDAARASEELVRVTKPGGRIVITSWADKGGLAEAANVIGETMAKAFPGSPPRVPPAWHDETFVRGLFEPKGATVHFEKDSIDFTAASPEAWFDEQEISHPVWLTIKRILDKNHWAELRARSIERLAAWNREPGSFRVTSDYFIITITRNA